MRSTVLLCALIAALILASGVEAGQPSSAHRHAHSYGHRESRRARSTVVGARASASVSLASPSPAPDLRAGMSVLMSSYDKVDGWWPSSWWNSAVALSALIQYTKQSGDRSWFDAIHATFELNRGTFPAGVRGDAILGNFTSRSLDDSQWWALSWIDAYDLTGNEQYLSTSAFIGEYVSQYYNRSTCGGGVWWAVDIPYKNAITNALYVRLTSALSRRCHKASSAVLLHSGCDVWLSRASESWNWVTFTSGLINSESLLNDGLTDACTNNQQTVWSYNNGMALAGSLEYYRASGNATALAWASKLGQAIAVSSADKSYWHLLDAQGVLTESCDVPPAQCNDDQHQFKGIFMRAIAELQITPGGALPASSDFFTTQLQALQQQDRTAANAYGGRWAGGPAPNTFDWRTQASAMQALMAIAEVQQHAAAAVTATTN